MKTRQANDTTNNSLENLQNQANVVTLCLQSGDAESSWCKGKFQKFSDMLIKATIDDENTLSVERAYVSKMLKEAENPEPIFEKKPLVAPMQNMIKKRDEEYQNNVKLLQEKLNDCLTSNDKDCHQQAHDL